MKKDGFLVNMKEGLKLAGKVAGHTLLGFSIPIAIVSSITTTAVLADQAKKQADELFKESGEYDLMAEARQVRLDFLQANKDLIRQKYQNGEITKEEYESFNEEYVEEMGKSDREIYRDLINNSTNPVIKKLLEKSAIFSVLAVAGGVGAVIVYLLVDFLALEDPLEARGLDKAGDAIYDYKKWKEKEKERKEMMRVHDTDDKPLEEINLD